MLQCLGIAATVLIVLAIVANNSITDQLATILLYSSHSMISPVRVPLLLVAVSLCIMLGNDASAAAFLLPTGPTTHGVGVAHSFKPNNPALRSAKEQVIDLKDEERVPSLSKSSSSSSSSRLPSNRENLEELYPQFPRTWVPLASTLELDPNRPTPVEFLGQTYVTYRRSSDDDNKDESSSPASWVVMDNACPHRLAPLSEGRIQQDTRQLQCSYHGWTFDADGSCQRIPQAAPQTEQAALQNPRSCVPTYSTHIDPPTGVLWIWPWKQDPLSFVGDEWRHPEGVMKKLFNTRNATTTTSASVMTYSRDQPYGWDTLVENLIDPAHIPFAHHGMQGSRSDAIPINMTGAIDQGEAGFSFEWDDRTMGMMRSGKGEFRAPYLVNYNAKFDTKDGGQRPWQLAVLCVPTKPGWSRVMVFSAPPAEPVEEGPKTTSLDATTEEASSAVDKKSKKKKKGSLASKIFKILPPWVSHLLSNKFFDSDMAFLHYQEQLRRPNGGSDTARLRGDARYFMPSECDRSIAALHGWIGQYAASYVLHQATQLPPAIYDRSKLFHRWGQHTSHCKICQDALASIQKWKRATKLALAGCVLLGFRHWAPRILAMIAVGIFSILGKIEGAFYKGEFKHYENH